MMVGVLTLSITARWLGPEGRGFIAATTTWVSLFSTVGYLSLGQVALHTAAGRSEREWLPPTLGSLLAVTSTLSLIGWIVALFLYHTTGGSVFNDLPLEFLAMAFVMLPFTIWENYGSYLLMAVDRLSVYNNAQFLVRTLSAMTMVVVLAVLNWGVVGALVVTVVAQAFVALAGLRELLRLSGGRTRVEWPILKSLMSGGMKLHLNAIGTFLGQGMSILIVNHFLGPAETGQYQLALQLVAVLLIIPASVSAELYTKITQHGPDGAWVYQRKIVMLTLMGMLVLSGIAALAAPRAVSLVAGEKFGPAVAAFQWLLPGVLGMTFSTVMAAQWIGRGWFWQVSALSLIGGGLNLVIAIVLVPEYGIFGAIWAALAVYGLSVFVNGGVAIWCEGRFRRTRSGLCLNGQTTLERRMLG